MLPRWLVGPELQALGRQERDARLALHRLLSDLRPPVLLVEADPADCLGSRSAPTWPSTRSAGLGLL
eukprot:11256820-Alexandrium_andersonii.AAC.1